MTAQIVEQPVRSAAKMLDQFKAARRAGTPIMAIKTTDPEATMLSIQAFNPKTPIIAWDCVNGWQSRNGKLGQAAIDKALQSAEGSTVDATVHFSTHLELAQHLPFDPEATAPTNPILFVMNGHKYFDEKDFVQALWNLRDPFKDSLRSVVLLGPDFNPPSELKQDVLVLDEPLPSDPELESIIKSVAKDKADGAELVKAVDALRGLGAFPAEQATAMSLSRQGLDIDGLWERKRQMINQTPGLTVWYEGKTFKDLGGCEEVIERLKRIAAGRARPKVIVWIDEIEKAMAGTGSVGDSSGTSQDQEGVLLSEMQDKGYSGMVFVGVPGGAKSVLAKIFGNELGVLTIKLDLGAAKGGIVGQSEGMIRQAMKIIEAVGGPGGAFFIITSNNIKAVKPEFKRRFTKGIWYFDLPTDAEKAAIVKIYAAKYPDVDVTDWPNVNSTGYTGAEVEACFKTAWEENCSLSEASRSIIPVAVSGKEMVEDLRREASGRYNSVSYPGVYDKNKDLETLVEPAVRTRMVAEQSN